MRFLRVNSAKAKRVAYVILLSIILIAEWLHWEVERTMINWAARHEPFPAPFYVWYWSRGLWEDLAITLVIIASITLTTLGVVSEECHSTPHK